MNAQGIAGRGPSLHGVGALAADFYLQTGRMPLPSPRAQPLRTHPAFSQAQIRALTAYVASFGGPAIPVVTPPSGDRCPTGSDCSRWTVPAATQSKDRGGIVTGAIVPSLNQATPTQVAQAIRIGPYVMPRFGPPASISPQQPDRPSDRALRAKHPAPRRSRWLGHRADRPDSRGNGCVAAGRRRAAADRAAAGRAHTRAARGPIRHGSTAVSDERAQKGRWLGRLRSAIVMFALWRLGGLRRSPQQEDEHDPSRREVNAPAWAQRLVAVLLALVALSALGFVALFALDPNTQLLGACLGVTLGLLALALTLAGRLLVPQETSVEPRPRPADPQQVRAVHERAAAGSEGITRRGLLLGAVSAAGAGLTAAAAIPVIALGPGLEDQLRHTPLGMRGRALRGRARQRDPRRSRGGGKLSDRIPPGCRPGGSGLPDRARPRRPIHAAASLEPCRLGAGGHPCLLEDLHPRGVRNLFVPLTAQPLHTVAWPGAGVPLSLLHLRCAGRRRGRVWPLPADHCRSYRYRSTRPAHCAQQAARMSGPVGPAWWGDSR